MKPVKAYLKTSFTFHKDENGKKLDLKVGKEVLVLGKWENSGSRTGLTYLMFDPTINVFLELDSGHLKVEEKENVKLHLPKFSYGQVKKEREIDGTLVVHFSPELVIPEGETTLTIGTHQDEWVVIVGVIQSNEYPSGAAYILYKPKRKLGDTAYIVDCMEVEIQQQGNMITM